MSVIVDTNVISDVIHNDPIWRPWAESQLMAHVGALVINPFIYAELCCRAQNTTELDDSLILLGVGYAELSRQALYYAAQAFLIYRKRGGVKIAPLPDFFIGAHAQASGFALLTRDTARYQTYFPSVHLISP